VSPPPAGLPEAPQQDTDQSDGANGDCQQRPHRPSVERRTSRPRAVWPPEPQRGINGRGRAGWGHWCAPERSARSGPHLDTPLQAVSAGGQARAVRRRSGGGIGGRRREATNLVEDARPTGSLPSTATRPKPRAVAGRRAPLGQSARRLAPAGRSQAEVPQLPRDQRAEVDERACGEHEAKDGPERGCVHTRPGIQTVASAISNASKIAAGYQDDIRMADNGRPPTRRLAPVYPSTHVHAIFPRRPCPTT
jgi:hypothetical protein